MKETSVDTKDFRVKLLTQEIKFAKMLAGNEFNAAIKEKHIKKLSTWLRNRTACSQPFTDNDCLRLWKGLFYSMWMSDKPLNQENIANKIASLLHSFNQFESTLQFFAMFLKTMALEWNGIDQWRIDKFMMLVRKVTRELIKIIKERQWSEDDINQLSKRLNETVLSGSAPRGLFMHFTELFFEEVGKISDGQIQPEQVTYLVKPFALYVASQSDFKLIQFAVKNVFNYLLFQSDAGREYKEKYDAWKSMGFPGNSVDDLVLEEASENGNVEDEEEEEENDDEEVAGEEEDGNEGVENGQRVLDPRAGRVDVVMQEIKFDPLEIVSILEELKYKKFTSIRNRKCIKRIVDTYKKFAGGTFPLGIQKLKVDRDELKLPDFEDKAIEFMDFEESLHGETRALKKLNKRKRKKILSSSSLFEEFQSNRAKRPKLKQDSNVWIEEDNEPTEANEPVNGVTTDEEPVKKKQKKKEKSNEKRKSISFVESDATKEVNAVAEIGETPKQQKSKEKTELNGSVQSVEVKKKEKRKSLDNGRQKEANGTEETNGIICTPISKAKQNEWTEPLKEGEVEYFVPSKKAKENGATRTVITPETPAPNKLKGKSLKLTNTPVDRVTVLKVSSVTKTALSSAEKKVKIVLKNNKSQEATEYIRQLKQSPQVPFDSAQKPLKGVLKPNLMPSPINPFYKKLIGFKSPNKTT